MSWGPNTEQDPATMAHSRPPSQSSCWGGGGFSPGHQEGNSPKSPPPSFLLGSGSLGPATCAQSGPCSPHSHGGGRCGLYHACTALFFSKLVPNAFLWEGGKDDSCSHEEGPRAAFLGSPALELLASPTYRAPNTAWEEGGLEDLRAQQCQAWQRTPKRRPEAPQDFTQ